MEIDYRVLTLRNRKLLYEFGDFLVQHRGVERRNLGGHYLKLRRFLRWVELKAKVKNRDLRVEHVQRYLATTMKKKSRSEKKTILTMLRGFLKFLYMNGRSRRRLDRAVPNLTIYKRAALPSYLTPNEVRRLLKAPNRRTESGRRDYAMLLLIARYGVRLLSAKWLKFEEIDWKKQIVTVPLLPDVARALLNYIKRDRGTDGPPEVFLTVKNRYAGGKRHARRKLSYFNHMSQFKHYYIKAGIDSTQKASHILRHSFATHLLHKEIPMKNIADLLGHRSIETTFIYTKVDVERLRSIASPWPTKGG
jgi:site-specific recombinase XerD